MGTAQIVSGCITATIAVALGVYASFTARRKGPILSNTYLLLGKEAREKADKKAEYKLVTVIFGSLSVTFALLTLLILFDWKWLYLPAGAIIAFVILYAIVDAIRTECAKRKPE